MKKRIWLVLLLFGLVLSGCKKIDFTLTKTIYELDVNDVVDLEYQTKMSNLEIEIKVEDETIASANKTKIKGLSKGTTKAKVFVNSKEQKQEITIVVSEKPYLKVEPNKYNVNIEAEFTLNISTNIANPVYSYVSSDSGIASVDDNGVIRTKTFGDVVITVQEMTTNLATTAEVHVRNEEYLITSADYSYLSECLGKAKKGDLIVFQGDLVFTEELELANLQFVLKGKLTAPKITLNNATLTGEDGVLESLNNIVVLGRVTIKNIETTNHLDLNSGLITLDNCDLGNLYLQTGGIKLINKATINQIDFRNITTLEDEINITNFGIIKETNDALVLTDLITKENLCFDNKGSYFTFKEMNYLNKDMLVNGKKRVVHQDGYNFDTVYLSDVALPIEETLDDLWLLRNAKKVIITTANYGLKQEDLNLIKALVLDLQSLDLSKTTLAGNMIYPGQFNGLASLKEVILPNNLCVIANNAFTGTGIEAIRIPETVTRIDELAFGDYKAGPVTLNEVHLEALVPQDLTVLHGFSPVTRFFVPEEAVDLYRSKWNQYSVTLPYLNYRKVYYNKFIFKEATKCQDYYFSKTSANELELVYYVGRIKENLIPNTYIIDGVEYNVTKVGDYAFRDVDKNGEEVELVFPDNVTTIGNYAFQDFGIITKLDLNKVTVVGDYAFENIEYTFTTIEAPNLTHLGSYGFAGLSLVKTINFPNLIVIGEYGLDSCRSLTKLYVPKLKRISNGGLVNMDSLVEIILGAVEECGSFSITAPKQARTWDFTHQEIDPETGLVKVITPHFGTNWNGATKAIDTVYCNLDVVEYFESKLPNATVIGR